MAGAGGPGARAVRVPGPVFSAVTLTYLPASLSAWAYSSRTMVPPCDM
jgi:hypothetical protein